MHTKEFQILRDPNRPNFELDEQNLGDDNTEEEHEYVDVPLDVQDVHSLHIEVSCSTSGCFMFSMCFLRFFHCPFFHFFFKLKTEFENYHRY